MITVITLSLRSAPFRTMKLFFIGEGERGKTTLLHRLRREAFVEKIDRTEGIDIEDWECRGQRNFRFPKSQSRSKFSLLGLCWPGEQKLCAYIITLNYL